jgi:hypothetical protein
LQFTFYCRFLSKHGCHGDLEEEEELGVVLLINQNLDERGSDETEFVGLGAPVFVIV